jgi:hypothetical protein
VKVTFTYDHIPHVLAFLTQHDIPDFLVNTVAEEPYIHLPVEYYHRILTAQVEEWKKANISYHDDTSLFVLRHKGWTITYNQAAAECDSWSVLDLLYYNEEMVHPRLWRGQEIDIVSDATDTPLALEVDHESLVSWLIAVIDNGELKKVFDGRA